MDYRLIKSLFLSGCLAVAGPVFAANIEVPNSNKPFTIDGELNDAIWADANRITLDLQTSPGENIAPSVKTDVYLVENGEQFLIAFRAWDPEPETIRAFLRDRDSAYSDDFVGVVLDTFNDEKRAFEFFVNPLGAQMDLINDDITRNEDDSWNATWAADGKIDSEGYIVEMALPLNILRFRPGLDRQVWGIDLLRFRPREYRERIANNPQDRNKSCYLCQLTKLEGFANAEPGKNLEVVPFVVAGRSESRDLAEGDPWSDETISDVGVDVRWGVTPSSTVNLTVNPDFSQVEADSAQLDVNTTFSLFFPERRPFFLDSADYFDTFVNVVHTRNIGEPDVGLKFTTKSGKNTAGIIYADDVNTNFIVPAYDGSSIESLDRKSQNLIARYRRDFGNNSTIGILTTSKKADGYHNDVIAVDGKYRIDDNDSISFQLLSSNTENPDEILEDDDGNPVLDENQSDTAARVRYNHDSRNWFWYAEHREFGRDFRADLGFVSKVDYEMQVLGLGRIWHGDQNTWWNRLRIKGDWDIQHREDGQLLEREVEVYASFNGPKESFAEIGKLQRTQFYDGRLYDQNRTSFYGEFKPWAGVEMGMWMSRTDRIDFANNRGGKSVFIEPWIQMNIGRNLLLSFEVDYQNLDIDEEELFNAYSADLRLTYQFSNRSYLRFTAQQTEVERNLALYNDPEDFDREERYLSRQLLYSYKLTPQTVFFLGYSDSGQDNDELRGFQKNGKSVFMKFSYAWIPK